LKKLIGLAFFVVVVSGLLAFQNCSPMVAKSGSLDVGSEGSKGITPPIYNPDYIDPASFSKCGASSVCFNGKTVSFQNDNLAAATVEVVSHTNSGFVAKFVTPKGRTITEKFNLVDGVLTATPAPGSRAQFCLNHNLTNNDVCSAVTIQGGREFNCGSALHWIGSYVGDTLSQRTNCTVADITPPAIDPTATIPSKSNSGTASGPSDPVSGQLEDIGRPAVYNDSWYSGLPACAADSREIIPATNIVTTADPNYPTIAYVPGGSLWLPTDVFPFGQTMSNFAVGWVRDTTSSAKQGRPGNQCWVSDKSNSCKLPTGPYQPFYSSTYQIFDCKLFCEQTMVRYNQSAGNGWFCNYGAPQGAAQYTDWANWANGSSSTASWPL
jgi:hypothetical protein